MAIYRDIYDGPPRWYTATRTRKKYIMIHATANDASAEAEASYAKRRPDRVSSHYYVDDDSIVQSLDTDYRAWHAGNREGNDRAIAYELTARNMNVGRAWWVDLDNIEWPLMVAAIARDCREHGIAPRNLTVAELREGRLTGFCMHFEGNEAWGGSDHTDPGPNFPMNHLVNQVQRALEEDVMTKEEVEEAVIAALQRQRKLPDGRTRAIGWLIEWGYVHAAGARRLLKAQQPLLEAAAQGQPMTAAQVAAVAAEVAAVVEAGLADEVADELGDRLGGDET